MLTVEDILMNKGPDVIIASPTTTVYEAARLMSEGKVGSLIIKEGGSIVGIFTERDLLFRVVARGRNPAATCLEEVMSSPVKSCRLSNTIHEAAEALHTHHIRHMAVVEDGSLVGVISVRDVVFAELKEKDQQLVQMTGRS